MGRSTLEQNSGRAENTVLHGGDERYRHSTNEVEIRASNQNKMDQLKRDERVMVKNCILPDTRISHEGKGPDVQKALCNELNSKTATVEQKLRVIEKLVALGQTHVTLKTEDGKSRDVRLEVEHVGNRRMVHMYATDQCGKEKTILRGISKGDHYERERDKSGHFVSYEGSGSVLLKHGNSPSSIGAKTGETSLKPVVHGSNREVSNSTNDRANGPGAIVDSGTARGTAYYPCNNALEGGYNDKLGKPLCTLQDYLAGKAPYVSVAMDTGFHYGQKLNIPELNAKYGRNIEFRVVDTGDAFRGKGKSRIDICVASASHANDSTINGHLTLQFV
ncbi:hypothetical protein BH10CYA1_BH10CYA1_55840 [soil metagenome]